MKFWLIANTMPKSNHNPGLLHSGLNLSMKKCGLVNCAGYDPDGLTGPLNLNTDKNNPGCGNNLPKLSNVFYFSEDK